MAFTSIIRKSTRNLAPLANRIIYRNHANYISTLHRSKFYLTKPTAIPFLQRFSTATADTNKPSSNELLLRVIDSEIKIARESDDHERVEGIPEGFPFKIDDNRGQQTVILTREYDGELVKVEVHMPDLVTGEDNSIDDLDDGTDESLKPTRSSIPLFVTVSKKNGNSLEFQCVAYPDEILIDSLTFKNPELPEDHIADVGPNFHDLDEKLRKAFHKYLDMRGIKPSTTKFLHEYMINKDSREYFGWLQDLKNFVEA